MKLACNYYEETKLLVEEGAIHIDYFKYPSLGFQLELCHDRPAFTQRMLELRTLRPVLYHGLYPAPHDLASPTLKQEFDFDEVDFLFDATQTPGISLHPTTASADSAREPEELVDTIASNLLFIQAHYPTLEFLTIENTDASNMGLLLRAEFYKEIVERTGCGFLLDIGHAYRAAQLIGEEYHIYLSKLPLDKVYEIHINGWYELGPDDNAFMAHTRMTEKSYALLQEALALCQPEIVTLEYGRDVDRVNAGIPLVQHKGINPAIKEAIAEQVERLHTILYA